MKFKVGDLVMDRASKRTGYIAEAIEDKETPYYRVHLFGQNTGPWKARTNPNLMCMEVRLIGLSTGGRK